MTGEEVRQVFEAVRPHAEMDRLCQECGVLERQRKRTLGLVVRALVMSAGTPGGAYQADVLRASLEGEGPRVARSAFSRWVDEPLERCMGALAEHALADARAQPVDLAGPLCGVTDWSIVDATTVTVRDALRQECPGTGGDAAIKVQTIRSVGCGAPVRSHFSPAREPASRHLPIDASWRGYGLLADVAYASLERLRACDTHGVRDVIRLNEHGKPKVDQIARGQVTQAFVPGTDVDALLADETLILAGRTVAADVQVGPGTTRGPVRLVGVHTPKGSCFFLTNLPPRIGPRQVGDLYRVRWEGDLSIRLDKSVNRLDAIEAEQPCTLKTLLPASMMASTIAARLAHTHNVTTRPQQPGAPRMEAPRHPRRLALQLGVSCQSIAQAFELTGTEATRRWDNIAELLTHAGQDPNWRRRPSVLDQLRGWKHQPLAPKRANSRDESPRHIKEAA